MNIKIKIKNNRVKENYTYIRSLSLFNRILKKWFRINNDLKIEEYNYKRFNHYNGIRNY